MDQQLIETIADGVATLTLNRPERLNALSAPIMDGLVEALLAYVAGEGAYRGDARHAKFQPRRHERQQAGLAPANEIDARRVDLRMVLLQEREVR